MPGRGNAANAARPAQGTCPMAGSCGACPLMGMPYSKQLSLKDARMRELLAKNGLACEQVRAIAGMEDPFHFRSKVASPFAPDKHRAGGILTGMYARGTHRLVRTDGCMVEDERANEAIVAIRSLMVRHNMQPYDEDTGRGFMRHAIVRVGHTSGEMLVTLITNGDAFPSAKQFCRKLVERCPGITSIVQNVNTRKTNVLLGQEERRLYGPGFILDGLCGLSFRISSQSFYQVNSRQTEVLYGIAMDLAGLDGTQRVLDAYCGTGTIGLVAAKRGAAEVTGVDSVPSAIADARLNARHNGVGNARFSVADAGAFMRELAASDARMDVVLMDPPRAGASREFLDALIALGPKRVVYISCNPDTQARDLAVLAAGGYRLSVVQPVDMFPHTDHVESVALAMR